jgi:hypothetical protein
MKKFEFVEAFSSFTMDKEKLPKTLKERWIQALHDPAFLFLCGLLVVLYTLILI